MIPRETPVRIPKDPEARARLAEMAGLTEEERHAIDVWCHMEEMKRARGVLLWDNEPRPETPINL